MNTINIILADDHVLVRDGIKSLLEDDKSIRVIDEASNGKETLEVIATRKPDLLVVDIRMPEMNGIEVVKQLKNRWPEIKALVLSMHDSEEYVVQSIQAGADGYLLKGSSKEEFLKALHTVADGGKYFTGDVSSIIINNFVDGKPKKETTSSSSSLKDDFNLTKRESQILTHVLKGLSNKEIAEELKISKRTAEVHRFNLMKKLDVKNQIELANKARNYGLV
ncbi:response regulator transcription factor [Galbibacter sp. BG1]|uniref:response regulator n=1 Tax=Galbibacter sp. BG1 TaxID=1170699 RepID=UPI0015C02780|nr:response regulator transcription factor [Galbibacter sp. BG1]QLE01952.1 response regulator transcription factor [Galbibacter sp. BG1]